MSNNGPFGALAEGLQAGFGMRQAYKQRKLDEEMDRLNREDRTKKAALDAEMQRQGMEARLREITNGENATKWNQDQAAKEFAARQDAAFAGASPQAQQMMLKGNQPVGVGVFAPGAGPADVQRFQERMPLVQQRLGQEEEDRARTIEAQQADARNRQSDSAARWLKALGTGSGNHDNSAGWTQTISTDEAGNPVVTRRKLMPGEQAFAGPTAQTPTQTNPVDQRIQASIAEQQAIIGDQRIARANGAKERWWKYGPDTHIAQAESKIKALEAEMQRQTTMPAALPLGVAPAAPSAPVPMGGQGQQYAPGARKKQNGITYQFDGRNWNQVP